MQPPTMVRWFWCCARCSKPCPLRLGPRKFAACAALTIWHGLLAAAGRMHTAWWAVICWAQSMKSMFPAGSLQHIHTTYRKQESRG